MNLPELKGFLDTSFVDWPGKMAAVVFLPGCNFRCPYCHNHQLVLEPGSLGTWEARHVLDRLETLRGWVDGVCVTGGEPTLHPGLSGLLELFRSAGWGVKLDTNGSRPAVLRALLEQGLLDAVAVDVKAPLEPIPYRRNAGAGADPDAVRESLRLLAAHDGWVDVRSTVHPRLLSRDELERLGRQVGEIFRGHGRVRFTPQRGRVDDPLDPSLREAPPLEPAAFEAWAEAAREQFRCAAAPRP